jgi:hypothetical protein
MEATKQEVKYVLTKNIGTLSEGTKGWKKEVNVVSWNDSTPKFDIRDWNETHDKMGKGVTLNKEEMLKLKTILNEMDIEETL